MYSKEIKKEINALGPKAITLFNNYLFYKRVYLTYKK